MQIQELIEARSDYAEKAKYLALYQRWAVKQATIGSSIFSDAVRLPIRLNCCCTKCAAVVQIEAMQNDQQDAERQFEAFIWMWLVGCAKNGTAKAGPVVRLPSPRLVLGWAEWGGVGTAAKWATEWAA